MTAYLNNYLSGAWQAQAGTAFKLHDPVTGQELAQTVGQAADQLFHNSQ